jgi:hypothetical protein
MTIPIDRTVEDMKLTGEASGKGLTSILMNETDEQAELILSITGNASGTMRSDVGPANVSISSRAQFTTQKRIQFDGERFRDDPATTETRNCTSVDCICPKRRGLIGCLVKRVGRRKADQATPELNAEAEKVTRETLSRKFDESVVDLMAQLNESTELDELVEKYFPETESWRTRSVTRPTFLVAGAGPESASIPEFLVSKDNEPQALSELWLRTTPGQAALLELMADLDSACDVLRDESPEEDSDEMADDVKLSRRDGWSVIEMGLPKSAAEPASKEETSR